MFTDHPWLAADPTLGPWQEQEDREVVPTGAWILPGGRPLAAELVEFLNAGTPPFSLPLSRLEEVEQLRSVLAAKPDEAPLIVVRAGPSGIETAAELADSARR